jgi:hypothetical protein
MHVHLLFIDYLLLVIYLAKIPLHFNMVPLSRADGSEMHARTQSVYNPYIVYVLK